MQVGRARLARQAAAIQLLCCRVASCYGDNSYVALQTDSKSCWRPSWQNMGLKIAFLWDRELVFTVGGNWRSPSWASQTLHDSAKAFPPNPKLKPNSSPSPNPNSRRCGKEVLSQNFPSQKQSSVTNTRLLFETSGRGKFCDSACFPHRLGMRCDCCHCHSLYTAGYLALKL